MSCRPTANPSRVSQGRRPGGERPPSTDRLSSEGPVGPAIAGPRSFGLQPPCGPIRFVKATLEVDCSHSWKVVLDGIGVEADDLEVDLDPGDHVLSLATVFDPKAEGPWTALHCRGRPSPAAVSADLERERELADPGCPGSPTVTSFELSPSGDRVVLSLSTFVPGTDERESMGRDAIGRRRRLASQLARRSGYGRGPVRTNREPALIRDEECREPKTAPCGSRTSNPGRSSEMVAGIEDWNGYLWSPTGKHDHFQHDERSRRRTRVAITRLRGLLDRMAGHRDLTELHLVDVSSGVRQQLTGGAVSASAAAFSPDGSMLLVTREVEDLSRRPYSRNELWVIDAGPTVMRASCATSGGSAASSTHPTGSACWCRPARASSVTSGLRWMGEGRSTISTDSSSSGTRRPTRSTPSAAPSIPPLPAARWSRFDGSITVLAIDGHRRSLFRYRTGTAAPSPRSQPGIESVGCVRCGAATARPSSPRGPRSGEPQRVVVAGAGRHTRAQLLLEPAAERFAAVRRGEVREWNFTAGDGREVAGRVYYPTSSTSRRQLSGDRQLLRRHLADEPVFRRSLPGGVVGRQRIRGVRAHSHRRLRMGAGTVHRARQRLGRGHEPPDHRGHRARSSRPTPSSMPTARRLHRRFLRRDS